VWVGYIALFGTAVETDVVMVVYPHESLDKRIASGRPLTEAGIEEAAVEVLCSAPAEADDGLRRSRQLDSDPVGKWYWVGRDEADCHFPGGRSDYVHDSRTDLASGFLCVDERASPAAWHFAAGTPGVTQLASSSNQSQARKESLEI
jgi:hypothetical protein